MSVWSPRSEIQEILCCYYQVRNSDYFFPGEAHNYFELTYVDNGAMTTTVEGEDYLLEKLDLMLYSPRTVSYAGHRAQDTSCSYLTVMFEMECENPYLLTNRVYHAHKEIYNALTSFIKVSNMENMYDDDLMLCYLKEILALHPAV